MSILTTAACKKDSTDTTPVAPVVVSIPDAMLAKAIRAQLKLTATADITSADMAKLDSLNLDAETGDTKAERAEIASLTGLQAATNLYYLHIGFTKVKDLSPIKDLKKMRYLRVNNTAISDLSPVSNYTTLTYFNANGAASITNIGALSKNTGLKELILRDVLFANTGMSTIANFTGLYRLNIRSTGITSITVLGELMAKGALLKTTAGAAAAGSSAELDIRGNGITDYTPIAAYSTTSVNVSK